jgi:hypothetical protein
MSANAVRNLGGAAERQGGEDTTAVVEDFTEGALSQARGDAPASWDGGAPGGNGAGGGFLVVLAGLLAVVLGGAFLTGRRRRARHRAEERERLEKLRTVVDEDITAFGEELRRVGFEPSAPSADDAQRADYTRALDSYDHAKRAMERARVPEDVRPVAEALEEGRFALATLDARVAGRELPQRRPPCFFDPRHGPSTQDARWAPPGGTEREVPVCAADATRLADGEPPMARTVDTADGRRPYWEAGPAYGPWAGGYFGGGLLPGLLVGTMLGNVMLSPFAYGAGPGGTEGGDVTGGDFDPGDFGGGFGGGDFGGGFGGFGGGDF